jgi:hypothetical protein
MKKVVKKAILLLAAFLKRIIFKYHTSIFIIMHKDYLAEVIGKKMENGDPFSEIKDHLLKEGYNESEIDSAYSSIKPKEREFRLEVNNKVVSSKKNKNSLIESFEKRKSYIYSGAIVILILLGYTYFKQMQLETLSRTFIVGAVYFLMILTVIIIKAIIVKATLVSARRKDSPGMFKNILAMITASDIFMLFIVPFTQNLSLWIPVILASVVFALVLMVFIDYNMKEVIASMITYCFLNFLILFLIKFTTTPQAVLKFFIGG